jgi:hypothetical protein
MAAASLNSTGSGLIKTDVYLISDQLKHIVKNILFITQRFHISVR